MIVKTHVNVMANTYTQIHIQAVFAVDTWQRMIQPSWKERLCQYISGIIESRDQKLLAINGMPDHLHIVFGSTTNRVSTELVSLIGTIPSPGLLTKS